MFGMLWFDNNPKTSSQNKILAGVEHYRRKYGANPKVIFVHPSLETLSIPGLEIKPTKSVNPNHFFICEGTSS